MNIALYIVQLANPDLFSLENWTIILFLCFAFIGLQAYVVLSMIAYVNFKVIAICMYYCDVI